MHASGPVHDVLVVGGGLVGASLAIALERAGLDVALVENAAAGTLPAVFDERNLSLGEATVHALEALGVMAKLRGAASPIRRIHASRRGDFGRLRLEASRYGREMFGQVVVARDFGQALEARLRELTGLVHYRPVRFDALEPMDPADRHRCVRIVDAAGERTLRARLLVAADGTSSAVREALGIASTTRDFGQALFVARVRAQRAPDGTAYERLGDSGPTALLPRADRQYGLVHAVPLVDADAVAALGDAAFLARVQDAFGWRVGRLLAVGERSMYRPVQRIAARTVAPRAVLVGNAAQTLHPVGAQGFNLGLRDAMTLAELLQAAPADAGDPALLAAYAARRDEDRRRSIAFSEGLAGFTANPSGFASALRSIGLLALDHGGVAQSRLVGGAMGYRGEVPALCRGPA